MSNDKLFDFKRDGSMIDNKSVNASKKARDFVKKLQANKAMGQNWKIDIFIDDNIDSLIVQKIPHSAAYEKGKFEYGISLNKLGKRGHTTLIASFPTKESAVQAAPYIIEFIEYRYNISLSLDQETI